MKKFFVTSRLSENISETPEGFLICLGVPIARTGEMVYGPGESPVEVGPEGKAIISRDAREVFRPETIASFEGKAFTIKHPNEFVNPSNWRVLAKGVLQNVRRGSGENENDLLADILVTDADAIALVKGGVREVSCGYECEYIQTGVGRGMQTNIIGNHCALVEQGRAGAAYAINDQQGAKMSKLSDKIKSIFAKAGDEAAKVADEASKETPAAGGEEIPKWAKTFMATVQDAMTQVASMSQPSKMGDEDKKDDKKDDKAKDEGGEESRLDKLEAKVDALLEKLSAGADEDKEKSEDEDEEKKDDKASDEEEMVEEEDEDGEGEAEDDDFQETPAGAQDEASRIEILAPGSKFSGKEAKRRALMKAYESKDAKAIIMNLNGGKAVDLKKASQKTVDHLFVGASEVLSLYRTKDFTKWKQVRDNSSQTTDSFASEGMTPEKINEINKKHYAKEGVH